jgi:hypothetical protein
MVESHLSPAQRLASGVSALTGTPSAFAVTQAAYRFLNNERIRSPLQFGFFRRVSEKGTVPDGCRIGSYCSLSRRLLSDSAGA